MNEMTGYGFVNDKLRNYYGMFAKIVLLSKMLIFVVFTFYLHINFIFFLSDTLLFC